MDARQNKPTIKGGGFFSSSNSFGGVIKKTKSSEASLIKNYESMEKATTEYNKSFKEHLSNLNKLDDYANFSGMKNLFQKVIMKDVITKGVKVDNSIPLLFSNYHIEKEPTPSAFRREHIINQVRYILATSFAGREHMLIKYMSVELGKSQFILNITTIENIKKSRTLDHNGFVIDASGTRSALKDILSSTKKNLRRRTALVEIGHGRSSSDGQSSKKKRTRKYSSNISSLLKNKKSSRMTRTSNSRNKSRNIDKNSFGSGSMDIGSSKESIKSLARKRHSPSNKLSSRLIDFKSIKSLGKQSKPSIYKRPSEKRPAAAIATIPSGMITAPTALSPMALTGDFAGKKQELLGGITPYSPLQMQQQALPGQTPLNQQYAQQQQQPPLYQQYAQQQQQPPLYQQKPKMCRDHQDAGSCQSDPSCLWNANYQTCKFNRPRNERTPGAMLPQSPPVGMSFPGASPAPAPMQLSPPPMMEAI